MNRTTWIRALLLVAVMALVGAGSAKADSVLQYSFVGPGSLTASFTLPQTPAVISPTVAPVFFTVATQGSINGGALQNLTVQFGSLFGLDGFGVDSTGVLFLNLSGWNLYSWDPSASSPTLLTGFFDGINLGCPWGEATLSVTTVPTPEPSSLVLLLLGGIVLAGVGLKKLL